MIGIDRLEKEKLKRSLGKIKEVFMARSDYWEHQNNELYKQVDALEEIIKELKEENKELKDVVNASALLVEYLNKLGKK